MPSKGSVQHAGSRSLSQSTLSVAILFSSSLTHSLKLVCYSLWPGGQVCIFLSPVCLHSWLVEYILVYNNCCEICILKYVLWFTATTVKYITWYTAIAMKYVSWSTATAVLTTIGGDRCYCEKYIFLASTPVLQICLWLK